MAISPQITHFLNLGPKIICVICEARSSTAPYHHTSPFDKKSIIFYKQIVEYVSALSSFKANSQLLLKAFEIPSEYILLLSLLKANSQLLLNYLYKDKTTKDRV
jgi:hypothetical protein